MPGEYTGSTAASGLRLSQDAERSRRDILDLNVLIETVGEDEDFIREVLGEFLATAPEMLDAIRQALAEGPGPLARAAHALKGACRSIGARELAEVCAALEAAGRAGQAPAEPDAMEPILAAYDELADVLDRLVSKAAA